MSLADAVRMVTANPARLLGLPVADGRDSLRAGSAADLTVLHQDTETLDIEIVRTVVAGRTVYEA